MTDVAKSAGYIFNTGTSGANGLPFQHLVTIDSPVAGPVISHTLGRQGMYLLSAEWAYIQPWNYEVIRYTASVLPTPGGTTDIPYKNAPKQTYQWKSKKFVMAGRTTFAAAKVVMDKGCVRLRLHIDGCCRYDAVVQNCAPFRLPDQLAGIELEIELIGTATIHEVHIASTIEELTRDS